MFFLIELLQFQICPQRLEYILLLIHVKITRYLGDSRSNIILELLYLHVLWNIKDLKWCPTTDYHAIKLWYNYIIVINMEGNSRIYRLPKGRGTDQWKWCDLFHGSYHDPRAVCISWYCPLYQKLLCLLNWRHTNYYFFKETRNLNRNCNFRNK